MAKDAEQSREKFRTAIRSFWKGDIEWDVSLAKMTTLKIGGLAWAVVRPEAADEAACVVKGCAGSGLPWVCMGRGSNILALDTGFPGVVITLEKMSGIRNRGRDRDGHHLVEVETGCSLAGLVKWCTDHALSGLEFAAGIPGSVGGAVYMNAGAWAKEMKDVIFSITWFDGKSMITGTGEDLQFEYRRWLVKDPVLAVKTVLRLEEGERQEIDRKCREYVAGRRAKQPYGAASAGSFFKNPDGTPAGKLIQDAGLKGTRVGGAVVSELHANFIVNSGQATAEDVLCLMKKVQEQVRKESGVMLEPEVHFLGRGGLQR
ncbi:MAG: UDP-N-acetylmuramate dehydrogenase [Proteobacteria bacterium]|nr:UDP-N-acetylmuramate dehydrogenase [Pseudomonadota bacterium]MBU1738971.1 UDP-N-acetylmuramate dehydrogenase [Pseudomonadota bacterium]